MNEHRSILAVFPMARSGTLARVLLCLCVAVSGVKACAEGALAAQFKTPPSEAGMTLYWVWFGSAITEEMIDRDLANMKAAGISGTVLLPVRGKLAPGEEVVGVFGDQEVVSMPTGMQVKRPSPGNEGPFFDHYDPAALQRHLEVAGEKLWGAMQDRRIRFRCDSLEDLKLCSDMHFVSGVNALMGTAYVSTHPSAGRPGWLGYWGPFISHHQTWWPHFPLFSRYVQRTSWLLQQGLPVAWTLASEFLGAHQGVWRAVPRSPGMEDLQALSVGLALAGRPANRASVAVASRNTSARGANHARGEPGMGPVDQVENGRGWVFHGQLAHDAGRM